MNVSSIAAYPTYSYENLRSIICDLFILIKSKISNIF